MSKDLVVGGAFAAVVLAAAASVLIVLREPDVATEPIVETAAIVEDEPEVIQEEPVEPAAPEFDSAALQTTLDQWVSSLPASSQASIMITTADGRQLASYQPDEIFFGASIYKLYVAHEGYRAVDAGDLDPQQDYINGNTLSECLDTMIRDSDSPCAEKLWVELGRQELDDTMKTYGLEFTDMLNITTSASDAAIILQRIARGEGLSEASQQAFLASMKDQIYDATFDTGFSDDVTVYNKIGFRDFDEYHDVAIVELADGRQLILSALTNGVGTARLRDLATQLEAVL